MPSPLLSPRNPSLAVNRRSVLAGLGAVLAATALGGCSTARGAGSQGASPQDGSQAYSSSTFAFDTYCAFKVYGDEKAPAKLAAACSRYDALFDLYKDGSDIARINAAGGAPTTVDSATVDIVKQALTFCSASDGLFDITIGAVSTLWNFDDGTRPTDEEIAAALPHVGWRTVSVDEGANTVTLADPEAKLDLGAIAKGYIADRLYNLLQNETDAQAAVISLGGNIIYFGEKPGGGTWNTGIRNPNDPGGSKTVGTAHVHGGSVVTSGLYERTFTQDGVTYWHILDPHTGMPVQTDVVSDTIVCASSTQADALSTTLFVAGSEHGAQIADGYDDTAAYFIKQDGSTAESSRWQDMTNFETA